jgi:transcription-repair coupling factor (superfamily II helicase)
LDKASLRNLFTAQPVFSELIRQLAQGKQQKIHLRGMAGSSPAFLMSQAMQDHPGVHVAVYADKEEAAYLYNDLVNLEVPEVYFFPASWKKTIHKEQNDAAQVILRTEVLNRINKRKEGENICVVTYPEALAETIVTREKLEENSFLISKGNKLSLDFLDEVLHEFHFERVDFVFEPGQYAVRGGIVDIFSYSADKPYRIDFFGDEVDSIRSFDTETQLSIETFGDIVLVPDINRLASENETLCFLEYAGSDAFIWTNEASVSLEKLKAFHEGMRGSSGEPEVHANRVMTAEEFTAFLEKLTLIECGIQPLFPPEKSFDFHISPQPAFHKNFELLVKLLGENTEKGYRNIILADNESQVERLHEIISSINRHVKTEILVFSLHGGFTDHDHKLCLYTDHQIFDRYHKFTIKGLFRKSEQITMQELLSLRPGDYVVHIDHGIGKFAGLQKIDVNGRMQEALRLVYRDNDILFVNIHSLHKISKYKGKDGGEPNLHKLGTGAWQKLKQSTKKKVKDIARELIALYSKRIAQPGFSFSADSYMQKELEASFIYEDTPDQLTATIKVKEGMESEHPMDMLVCGDVGFGKTEIAIRAAFKAVADSKQVAVLVPTTILALQHYKTFTDRLKGFPCTVDYLSRFRSAKDQKEIVKKLGEGKIDIIIGTHKLVGSEVEFKDLGLLVIDEEQKFGVAVKEKLKKLKLNVDTVTLTATPIPRTLQFSLMGARDLAIIQTPPPNRHPILTEIHSFNEFIISEAINFEVSRGGQVFFIHNRVQNIFDIQHLIKKVAPDVRSVVAHGQMEGHELEKVMMEFISGDYDVLISTSIIESGLDIPNANTIIVNNAHHFGLSDLHQLRGRVGRSNRKAFCYLLAPPVSGITPEARRRLKAIEENSELGSGFNISMQDLDIRGAGNLLGAEQSGFIAEIGYETYQKILAEAMQELRDEEFPELQEAGRVNPQKSAGHDVHKTVWVNDCQIDTDMELSFPESYISNASERIRLYRELDNMRDEAALLRFEKQLGDRFGTIPHQAASLMNVVRLRWKAEEYGFEKIVLRERKMVFYFLTNQMSPYYSSAEFKQVLGFVQRHTNLVRMKEAKERLSMSIKDVVSIEAALDILKTIEKHGAPVV